MNESTDTTQQPGPPGGPDSGPQGGAPPPPPRRPPLRRSVADRKIAGVAGGLGRHFDVDPLIFRVVLVTLAIFGGSGLLLYAIGWLLVPEDGEDESEASRLVNGRATGKIVGAVILAIVGLIAVGNFANTGFGFGGLAALVAIGAAAYLISRGDMGWRPRQPARTPPQDQSGPAPHTPAPHASASYAMAPYGPPAPGAYGQTPGTAYAAGPAAAASSGPAAPPTWNAPPAWTPPPAKPREPRSPLGRVTVSIAALAAAALVSWNIATAHDVPAEVVIAACLGVVALGLMVGAFVGRARGLIALGIILAVAASIAGVTSDINFHGGAGERRWAPQTVAAVRDHGPYRLGVGSSELDLSNLHMSPGQTLEVDVRQGIGDLTVIVPADVAVKAVAEASVGELRILDAPRESGTDMHVRVTDPEGAAPVIVLNTDLGVGEVEVRRATS